jgi:SWI/SNF-related matrix-associated actin-dependent regulator 1 of chromatin subfamily A
MTLLPLNWSEPKLLNTRNGQRELRKAPANETFWELWRSDKVALKAEGYGLSRNDDGTWEVCHWALPDGKTQEQAAVETSAALLASRATDAEISIPLSDRARERGFDYFGFQRAGIKFASERDACLIGDDMGVGKTIQIIGVMNVKRAQTALVVCPASMLLTWAKELHVWLVEQLPITVVTASKVKQLDDSQFPGINDQVTITSDFPKKPRGVVVINYDILHKFETQLRSVTWDVVAMDESQYVKSSTARRTEYALGRKERKATMTKKGKKAISPLPGKTRILASGTPMKNRPIELFSQLNYLDPAAWPNAFAFGKRYCAAHQGRFGWDFKGASNLDELNLRLRSSIMIRRMKSEVLLDLPSKTRQVIATPGNGHSDLIEKEIAAHHVWEAARASKDFAKVGVAGGELAKIRVEVGLAKIPSVLSHLEEIEQKTLLFCRHKEVQARLAEALKDRGVVIYNGDMNVTQKEEAKVRFQTDDSIQFFIGTIGAAKEGLTLTAANYVLFAELEWTPADLNQAEDRCYRQGQKNAVLVQHLVFDGSLDDKMLVTILKKQRILDATLDKDVAVETPAEEVKKAAPRKEDITLVWKKAEETVAASALPQEQVALIHTATKLLAGMCDGAYTIDGAGFNRMDTVFGHSLANAPFLSQKQAQYARKMVRKYKRQLPEELYTTIYGDAQKSA